jgi:serine/threonine protein kinase
MNAIEAKRLLREIKLLNFFNKSETIIKILDIVNPVSRSKFDSVYIVTELMETDLEQIIRQNALSEDHRRLFLF